MRKENNNKTKLILDELRTLGLLEILYHLAYKMASSKNKHRFACLMMIEKERYYEKIGIDGAEQILEYLYLRYMNAILDLSNVKTFTEKIQYLKLMDMDELKCQLSDKFLVREWVHKKNCENLFMIPLINTSETYSQIDFSDLPEQFVLKMNHGSGMNYIVKEKSRLTQSDFNYMHDLFYWWKRCPFYADTMQLQYKNIKRKIVVEKYIEQMDLDLFDYKVHCFNGEPRFIQCIGSRNIKTHTGFQNNYDFEWNKLEWTFEDYPNFVKEIPKPECLDDMYNIAKKLSEGFIYVRVDLYEIDGKVYFGEMTFTPASGYYPYKGTWTYDMDIKLGKYIRL